MQKKAKAEGKALVKRNPLDADFGKTGKNWLKN